MNRSFTNGTIDFDIPGHYCAMPLEHALLNGDTLEVTAYAIDDDTGTSPEFFPWEEVLQGGQSCNVWIFQYHTNRSFGWYNAVIESWGQQKEPGLAVILRIKVKAEPRIDSGYFTRANIG